MSLAREFTTKKYGFHTKWELSAEMLHRRETLTTEVKTVEGMPDVKWSLSWSSEGYYFELHFIVESENEIEYTMFHQCPYSVRTYISRNGTSTGQQKILLDQAAKKFEGYTNNDGKFTIDFHGFFSYTKKANAINDGSIYNAADWGLRLKEDDSTDFDIIVDGQTIHIHKLIVRVESKVFTKTFEADFKEAKEKKVTITDFKYEIVQAAIDYCYGQNISAILEDQQKAIDLLYFANKYDFLTLKQKMETILGKKLCKENVSILASTADKTNSLQLRQACINFLRPLFNTKEGLPAEEIATLDSQFLIDLVSQALNN
uniref:BTB domain-containing protein n=1 Tax=Panagrolaimus davidi TaxID=227884 RepID=A0A914QGY3_9BILA